MVLDGMCVFEGLGVYRSCFRCFHLPLLHLSCLCLAHIGEFLHWHPRRIGFPRQLSWLYLRTEGARCFHFLGTSEQSATMNLTVLWLVTARMWIDIVCLHIRVWSEQAFGAGASVVVEGRLAIVSCQGRVRHPPRLLFQFLIEVTDLLSLLIS